MVGFGADKAECNFLKDSWWPRDLITWEKLHLLLQGHILKLPAPKNYSSSNVCIQSDVPVFAISISPISYLGRNNPTDPNQNDITTRLFRRSKSRFYPMLHASQNLYH